MFTTQSPISNKKWFLCQNGKLLDLNAVFEFHVEQQFDIFPVFAYCDFKDTENCLVRLGEFKNHEEAKEYIKKIHLFLVAQ